MLSSKDFMKELGKACREFRKYTLCTSQYYIAYCLDCSVTSVSAFEKGKINSIQILSLYVSLGFDFNDFIYRNF